MSSAADKYEREHNGPLYVTVTSDGVYVSKENGETEKLGAVEVTPHDNREKLEADIMRDSEVAFDLTIGEKTVKARCADVLGWLDRQANITARDSGRWRSKYMDLLDERRELENEIDELQVERDKLMLKLERRPECEACERGTMLTALRPKRTVEDVLADLQANTIEVAAEYLCTVIDADEYRHELARLVEHAVDEIRGIGVRA